jgi:hypothetical protein
MALKPIFDEIVRKLPKDDTLRTVDKFTGEKRPWIVFGNRKLVFSKKEGLVYYGYKSDLFMRWSFKPTQEKEMFRFLIEPNSPPPALVKDVLKIVAVLTKKGCDVSVSWSSTGCVLNKTIRFGEDGFKNIHRVDDDRKKICLSINEAIRWLSPP